MSGSSSAVLLDGLIQDANAETPVLEEVVEIPEVKEPLIVLETVVNNMSDVGSAYAMVSLRNPTAYSYVGKGPASLPISVSVGILLDDCDEIHLGDRFRITIEKID
jgi:hypothetical protein